MKNLTDFRNTVETSVDPRLSVHFFICLWLHIKVPLTPRKSGLQISITLPIYVCSHSFSISEQKKTVFPLLST